MNIVSQIIDFRTQIIMVHVGNIDENNNELKEEVGRSKDNGLLIKNIK